MRARMSKRPEPQGMRLPRLLEGAGSRARNHHRPAAAGPRAAPVRWAALGSPRARSRGDQLPPAAAPRPARPAAGPPGLTPDRPHRRGEHQHLLVLVRGGPASCPSPGAAGAPPPGHRLPPFVEGWSTGVQLAHGQQDGPAVQHRRDGRQLGQRHEAPARSAAEGSRRRRRWFPGGRSARSVPRRARDATRRRAGRVRWSRRAPPVSGTAFWGFAAGHAAAGGADGPDRALQLLPPSPGRPARADSWRGRRRGRRSRRRRTERCWCAPARSRPGCGRTCSRNCPGAFSPASSRSASSSPISARTASLTSSMRGTGGSLGMRCWGRPGGSRPMSPGVPGS